MEDLPQRSDILRPETLTPFDAGQLVDAMSFADQHQELLTGLDVNVRAAILELGGACIGSGQFTQLKKLFKNAVVYVAEGRVSHAPEGGFYVGGNTNDHHVTVGHGGHMSCDCDLFNGRAQFAGNAGECSHIQTANLFMIAEQSLGRGGDAV